VSASGGEPEQITKLDSLSGETAHRFPQFLPDGRRYLYTTLPPKDGKFDIYLGELDSPKREFLLSADSGVLYSKTGHLLYQRNGALVAQEFNASNSQVRGDPITLGESMSPTGFAGGPGFSVSDNGTLAYTTLRLTNARLAWFDTQGREVARVPIEPAPYIDMGLSPDDRRVALVRKNSGAKTDIWIGDLDRGVVARFSQEQVSTVNPYWSPDGTRIAYMLESGGPQSFVVRAVGGGAEAQVYLQSDPTYKALSGWTPDGRSLVYASQDPETRFDIWVLPLEGDQEPHLYLRTPFIEWGVSVSDDGRWMAYWGNESGHGEVYVQGFPRPGARYQVTKGGGLVGGWLAGGKKLFFWQRSSPTSVQIADVIPGGEFRLGPARTLCVLPRDQIVTRFTREGKRVLSLVPSGEPAPNSITVVLDWAESLKRK
jgi:Tol biopolymer transport system component